MILFLRCQDNNYAVKPAMLTQLVTMTTTLATVAMNNMISALWLVARAAEPQSDVEQLPIEPAAAIWGCRAQLTDGVVGPVRFCVAIVRKLEEL